MGDPSLAVSWDAYENNICRGLSLLQQRGEFVDMTLAADGHLVKVHQLVMSLVSPYIKELISSAHCQHPVVFLNKVSYETLQAILEYVYTGEVVIPRHKLTDFLQACKDLHIRGLGGDNIHTSDSDLLHVIGARAGEDIDTARKRKSEERARKREKEEQTILEATRKNSNIQEYGVGKRQKIDNLEMVEQEVEEVSEGEHEYLQQEEYQMDEHALDDVEEPKQDSVTVQDTNDKNSVYPQTGSLIQYSLSNQGNIQLILNRYIYCMRHTRKNNERMWRCVNYNPTGCNATCVTKDDMVIFRGRAHNHPFHDKQILKRLHSNNIYTAFHAVHSLTNIRGRKQHAHDPQHDT